MCLLTFLPGGVQPDVTALRRGALFNSDGHGYAIVADRRLVIGHGLDAGATIDAFVAARHRHPHGPALFHSRLCTHGQPTIDNCQPFHLGGDERTVLAHNGVLPRVVHPRKGDPRCDTRIAAEEYLPTALGPLRLRANRLRLQRWMTDDNRMVLLTVDRRFRQQAYLLNEHTGIWHEGRWYSNEDFLPARHTTHAWPYDDDLTMAAGAYDRCPACDQLLDPLADECPWCGWCVVCEQPELDCRCYAEPDLHPWWRDQVALD